MRSPPLILACAWVITAPLLPARNAPANPSATPAPTQPSITEQLAGARQLLNDAEAAAHTFRQEPFSEELKSADIPPERALEYQENLAASIRNFQGAIDALGASITNREALKETRAQPEPNPPKNDEDVSRFHAEIDDLGRDLVALETQAGLDQSALEHQRGLLDQSERALRQLTADLDAATPETRPRAALLLKLEEGRKQEVSSALLATSSRIGADELERERLELRRLRLENVLAGTGLDSVLSKARSEAGLADVASESTKIRARVGKARSVSGHLVDQLEELRAKGSGHAPEGVFETAAQASLVAQKITRGYELWLAGLRQEEKVWRAAAAVAAAPESPEALKRARDAAIEAATTMMPWQDFFHRGIQDSTRAVENLKGDPAARQDPWTVHLLELHQARLEQLLLMEDGNARFLNVTRRMQSEASTRLARVDLPARISRAVNSTWESTLKVWNSELFTTEQVISGPDGARVTRQRGTTLGALLVAVALVGLLLAVARYFARLASTRFRKRLAMDNTRASFFERIIFLALAATIILSGLNWLHIPLTTFAFLGGALAIAAGFGLQNLLNNFVSGIILAIERRVNIGDIIEIDTVRGTVLSLGARYSTIQQSDGVEILLPNSFLLERRLSNWTLSDPLHQFDITLDMAAHPEPERILQILETVVEKQNGLAESPRSRVFLANLSDKSLSFRISYWVNIRTQNPDTLGSEIRLRTAQLLREAGLLG